MTPALNILSHWEFSTKSHARRNITTDKKNSGKALAPNPNECVHVASCFPMNTLAEESETESKEAEEKMRKIFNF